MSGIIVLLWPPEGRSSCTGCHQVVVSRCSKFCRFSAAKISFASLSTQQWPSALNFGAAALSSRLDHTPARLGLRAELVATRLEMPLPFSSYGVVSSTALSCQEGLNLSQDMLCRRCDFMRTGSHAKIQLSNCIRCASATRRMCNKASRPVEATGPESSKRCAGVQNKSCDSR